MSEKPAWNPEAFKKFEYDGWETVAESFAKMSKFAVTSQAIAPLLDAVQAAVGTRLLDVACGGGHLVAEAGNRGAGPLGLDFSPGMIAQAQKLNPDHEFQQGDAEGLNFPESSFDAVTCNFGLLHFANPEKALGEIHRVLKQSGRCAFTVWRDSGEMSMFAIIFEAVETHGDASLGIPPGPEMFHFGNPDTAKQALEAAGFIDVKTSEQHYITAGELPDGSPEEIKNIIISRIKGNTARYRAMLEAQSEAAQAKIHQAIFDAYLAASDGKKFQFPMPALLISGKKP